MGAGRGRYNNELARRVHVCVCICVNFASGGQYSTLKRARVAGLENPQET